ncbi:hypothetical protein Athai_49780 [Actinocatenispora thailandica]|uniref:HTH luxR-type domain-containing protein n=1 Tax=Actinocatenispora thailandica TaxID=227318 RepID=A0A7R7DTN8_9ACTN|nr:helix-turn-helix transcriptional regulator [Actinocatenispora thailandica]BCJ37475.1 hypothetical protein Athai_49780 [Actinocatenispora thailandica]
MRASPGQSADGEFAGRHERVVLLCRGCPLTEALAAGLRLCGWRTSVLGHPTELAARDTHPLVLVEDESGELPSVVAAGRVVAVAGVGAVDALRAAVAAGARAVNAQLPYRVLLAEVRAALSLPVPSPAQRQQTLLDLRARTAAARCFWSLTDRERAVLVDVASGLRAEAIAARRTVSLPTVRSQIAAILHKLGVRSQPAAVALLLAACPDPRITDALARFHQNYR